MSSITKKAAAELVARIRVANVTGHMAATSTSGLTSGLTNDSLARAGFMGGLEAVLHDFLVTHGCMEAAKALGSAMNDTPTAAEIEARRTQLANLGRRPARSAA